MAWTLAQIDRFEEIIDVRSPAEYDVDHIPGASNFPVLDDAQRAEVGTLYKRVSPLEARKRGAALVADNVARHLRTHFRGRGGAWRPLVYCWRGGARSAALTHVLREIGWRAEQLPGGYKAYRKTVVQTLADAAPRLHLKVLCGFTGTGKSRLLTKLAERGAQTIDLESLADHRGSVLGAPPASEQPSQKRFESLLCRTLRSLDLDRPVHVESESRRIGRIQVPADLIKAMHAAECVRVEAGVEARTDFLLSEYEHFLKDDARLRTALETLTPHVGRNKVETWLNRRETGDAKGLVRGLLQEYYDPLYLRSMKKHFARYSGAALLHLDALDDETLDGAAQKLIEQT